MPPKTAAGYAADENLKITYDWEHPEKGKMIGICCIDMERETGHDQSGFWLVANGKSGSTHGWICLSQRPTRHGQSACDISAHRRFNQAHTGSINT